MFKKKTKASVYEDVEISLEKKLEQWLKENKVTADLDSILYDNEDGKTVELPKLERGVALPTFLFTDSRITHLDLSKNPLLYLMKDSRSIVSGMDQFDVFVNKTLAASLFDGVKASSTREKPLMITTAEDSQTLEHDNLTQHFKASKSVTMSYQDSYKIPQTTLRFEMAISKKFNEEYQKGGIKLVSATAVAGNSTLGRDHTPS